MPKMFEPSSWRLMKMIETAEAKFHALRYMADHPWEPGPYGTCRRCGTDPNTSFPQDRHPDK